jgi:integrase
MQDEADERDPEEAEAEKSQVSKHGSLNSRSGMVPKKGGAVQHRQVPKRQGIVACPARPCRAYPAVARLAEIDKPVSLHSLRHSFGDRALRRRGLCSPFSS